MNATDLNRAERIARLACKVQAEMWGWLWPDGHCAVSSLTLAPTLRASLDVDFRVVVGKAHNCRPHAWIESPEGDIVDPTYGQFTESYPLLVLPAHMPNGHCGEIKLTLDQEEAYRRTIRPRLVKSHGWSAYSSVKQLFEEHPLVAI